MVLNNPPSLPLHNHKFQTSKMTVTNFNGTTPQPKTVKSLLEAYLSLDISNTERFLTKDLKFQTFPKVSDLPDEVKGAHFESWGPLLAMMSKVEVWAQQRLWARRLTSVIPSPMSTK